jgi:hypothetical protein
MNAVQNQAANLDRPGAQEPHPRDTKALLQLLQMPLNEDVFEKILGILAEERCKKTTKKRII